LREVFLVTLVMFCWVGTAVVCAAKYTHWIPPSPELSFAPSDTLKEQQNRSLTVQERRSVVPGDILRGGDSHFC